jgi:hypothetical protein
LENFPIETLLRTYFGKPDFFMLSVANMAGEEQEGIRRLRTTLYGIKIDFSSYYCGVDGGYE